MDALSRNGLAIEEPAGRSEQYLVGWRFGGWYLQQGGDADGRPGELWSSEKASGFLDRLAVSNPIQEGAEIRR